MNFPKLGNSKNSELIEFEKEKKELIFRELTRKEEITKIKASYRISDVVKGAREQNEHDLSNSNNNVNLPSQKKIKAMNGKNMQTLTPLKLESEARLKADEEIYSGGSISLANNKLKLNPIGSGGSKKDVGKYDNEWNT